MLPPTARPTSARPPAAPRSVDLSSAPQGQVPSWQGLMSYQPDAPVAPNATRRPVIRQVLLWGGIITVFGLAALLLGAVLLGEVGVTAAALAALTGSLALGIVVPVFLWIDRLEEEPPRLLWFAFLWGALVSTLGSMLLNELGVLAATAFGVRTDPLLVAAVFVAPVVEELLKGLGVLVIFLGARREFNGVTDGIVYAGLVAAGFAFLENILYLGRALAELGTGGFVATAVMRLLFSPFAHPMFTVMTGIALGMAAHRRRISSVGIVLVGYALAVLLHGLWNYSATDDSFLILYGVVQIPLFLGFVGLLLWTRRRESHILRDALTGYGMNGWFTPAEVAMLADPAERRRARAWAKGTGGARAERAMTAFQDESGELAMVRRHLQHSRAGTETADWQAREAALLHTLTGHRKVFVPGL